jgi:serine/threonine protein phosphatase PrpC
MNFEFACLTDPGRVRTNNEDCVAASDTHGLAVLADGMGGYNAGEIASAMAVSFIATEMGAWLLEAGRSPASQDVKRALEATVTQANRQHLQRCSGQCAVQWHGHHHRSRRV